MSILIIPTVQARQKNQIKQKLRATL